MPAPRLKNRARYQRETSIDWVEANRIYGGDTIGNIATRMGVSFTCVYYAWKDGKINAVSEKQRKIQERKQRKARAIHLKKMDISTGLVAEQLGLQPVTVRRYWHEYKKEQANA